MIYCISDTHLDHKNIIGYQQREFSDVFEMNKTIIDRWNSTVKDEDTVIHLGDFCFNSKPQLYYEQLKGKKIFLKGNHDYRYLKKLPFETDSIMMIKYKGYAVVLCHYPMVTWQHKGYKSIHVHGHTHRGMPTDLKDRRYNVCVENIDYRPISLDKIIQEVEEYHKNITD